MVNITEDPMQRFINAMNEVGNRERAGYHLTLGKLVAALVDMPDDLPIVPAVGDLSSYRGYYSDLAVEPGGDWTTGDLLKEANAAIGQTFEGYKGGDFKMHERTPLWLSAYGICSGLAILDIEQREDAVHLITKDVHDDE